MVINPRSLDHIVGIACGVVGSLALWSLHKWVAEQRDSMRRAGDELHQQRHGAPASSATHLHSGSCHCRRVRFRIRSGSKLRGVDIKSKIRFPRVTIPINNFEALTDDSMMSHYAVKCGGSIGIYTFCSFCGVHVVFAPSVDPTEVQVNMDCVERTNVRDESVTYMTTAEASPCSANSDAARNINRKGVGSTQGSNSHVQEESPPPALAGMVAMLSPDSPEDNRLPLDWATGRGRSPEKFDKSLDKTFGSENNLFDVHDLLNSIPGMLGGGSPGSPALKRDKFSPPMTPSNNNGSSGKSNFAFDSPIHKQLQMHKQLQRHLKQYLEPNELEQHEA